MPNPCPCMISIQLEDKIVSVYCENMSESFAIGKILVENYNTKRKILSLLKHGSIVELRNSIVRTEFKSRNTPVVREYKTKEELISNSISYNASFIYLFENNWYWLTGDMIWKDLEEEVERMNRREQFLREAQNIGEHSASLAIPVCDISPMTGPTGRVYHIHNNPGGGSVPIEQAYERSQRMMSNSISHHTVQEALGVLGISEEQIVNSQVAEIRREIEATIDHQSREAVRNRLLQQITEATDVAVRNSLFEQITETADVLESTRNSRDYIIPYHPIENEEDIAANLATLGLTTRDNAENISVLVERARRNSEENNA